MYTLAEKQKVQAGTTAAPAQRETGAPTTAVPNSAMASMVGAGGSGYANPNLDQMMQARMGGLHEDMAAEKEAVDVGRQFMNSTDVVGDMSRAYGQDLSGVRLHTDPGAAQKAEERGVDAFSTGRDIYFAQGAYDRSDPASRGLLAHELSHSLQQGVGGDASVMAQSAPVGAEQGGILDWFKEKLTKPKQSESEPELEISEPQLDKGQTHTWGGQIFRQASNQRDKGLASKSAKKRQAAQERFMGQMNLLSNSKDSGRVTGHFKHKTDGPKNALGERFLDLSEYSNFRSIQDAALNQILMNMSDEDLQANTDLQNRITEGFNSKYAHTTNYSQDQKDSYFAREAEEGHSNEATAYFEMLRRLGKRK